jgi:hypothetical protein
VVSRRLREQLVGGRHAFGRPARRWAPVILHAGTGTARPRGHLAGSHPMRAGATFRTGPHQGSRDVDRAPAGQSGPWKTASPTSGPSWRKVHYFC